MTARRAALLNYAAYQIGWLAAVVGAGAGYGFAGGALALLLTAGHVVLARQRSAEALLVAAATALGYLLETWQMSAGTYASLADATPGSGPPLWLVALWAQFATTFRMSLWAVVRRPLVAAAFGALGGPIAFVAGERIGAAVLGVPIAATLLRLGVTWGLAMIALSGLVRAVDAQNGEAGYRAVVGNAGAQAVSSRKSKAT